MKINASAAFASPPLALPDGATLSRPITSLAERLLTRVSRTLALRRAHGELAMLDDRLLRDIGMTGSEIARVRASTTGLPLIWS